MGLGLVKSLRDRLNSDSAPSSVETQEPAPPKPSDLDQAPFQEHFESMTPEEIERIFDAMTHETRLTYVELNLIGFKSWRVTYRYIRNNPDIRRKWGLGDQSLIDDEDNCREHEANVKIYEYSSERQTEATQSRSHSQRVTGETRAGALVEGRVRGEDEKSNQATTTAGRTASGTGEFFECPAADNCKINRRFFINYGKRLVIAGPDQAEFLEAEFERAVKEAGVEHEKESA